MFAHVPSGPRGLDGRIRLRSGGWRKKAEAEDTQTLCQPHFSEKLGNLVGGEHYESKAFWSHDYVSDVAGSKRGQVELVSK